MILCQRRLLGLVAADLPTALIAPATVAAIAEFAGRLPPAFTWGILELRLAEGDARADLEVCAARLDGSPAALAAAFAPPATWPAIGSLGPLLTGWAAGTGALTGVDQLFLEFDEPVTGPHEPLVFVATDHDGRCRPRPGPRTPGHAAALARETLALVPGGLQPLPLSTWERCLRLLPPGGRALTVAPLAPRGRAALRLDAQLPRSAVTGWLAAIGWPGDRRELARLQGWLAHGWQHDRLQLDLDAGVGPALGALYRPAAGPHEPARWLRLFEALCRLGPSVCAPAKAAAALTWPGTAVVDEPGLGWPIAVQRDLDVKLTLREGAVEAKVYLSYCARWAALGPGSARHQPRDVGVRPAGGLGDAQPAALGIPGADQVGIAG